MVTDSLAIRRRRSLPQAFNLSDYHADESSNAHAPEPLPSAPWGTVRDASRNGHRVLPNSLRPRCAVEWAFAAAASCPHAPDAGARSGHVRVGVDSGNGA